MEVTNELFMNQPIPGESMTVKPGTYPYENPPLIDGPVEAMEYIMDIYLQIENQNTFLKMVDSGVPIEYLVNVVTKSAFMNGIFTVDVAEVIKPALLLHILADSRDMGIKAKIFNDADTTDFEDQQYMDIYKEFKPEEYEQLINEQDVGEPLIEAEEESFLDMGEI